MRRIKLSYGLLIVILTVLWLVADTTILGEGGFFMWRAALVNYTGIIAMGVMSIGMMLAIRPVRVEPLLGGLDKSYRLHKWLGVTGLVMAILHWLWTQAPKWMVGWGWLTRPVRKPAAEQTIDRGMGLLPRGHPDCAGPAQAVSLPLLLQDSSAAGGRLSVFGLSFRGVDEVQLLG